MGAINTREFADPRAEPAVLKPLTDASHGSDRWLINGLPDIRMIEKPTRVAARDAAGSGWIGLYRQHDYVVTGLHLTPTALPLAVLAAVVAGKIGTASRRARGWTWR